MATENTHLATGKIEVVAETIEILAKSDALPFQVSTALENESENKLPGEDVRLKYRYLDLRRPSMQHNLKLRSDMAKAARHALEDMDFTEVETPTFIKSTRKAPATSWCRPVWCPVPGTPCRSPRSSSSSCSWSPVSSVTTSSPAATVMRTSAPTVSPSSLSSIWRWPTWTREDVMAMTEKVIAAIWKSAGYEVQLPLPRITWKDAMDKYGSDKPDLRFGNPLVELTEYFKNTPFRVFQAPYVGAVVFKGDAATPRRQFDAWQDWARQRGAKGLAYVVFGENGELKGPVAKNLSDEERNGLREAVGAEEGDAVFFAAGSRESAQLLLGAVRVSSPPAKACWIRRSSLSLGLWTSRCSSHLTIRMMTMWLSATQVDLHAPPVHHAFQGLDRQVRQGSRARHVRLLRHRLQGDVKRRRGDFYLGKEKDGPLEGWKVGRPYSKYQGVHPARNNPHLREGGATNPAICTPPISREQGAEEGTRRTKKTYRESVFPKHYLLIALFREGGSARQR